MTSHRHRIGYIDGLRAVAVLSVVADHAWRVPLGTAGVQLFFVLSGFCLSYPALAKLFTDGSAAFNVVGYAARRIVRIVPPYWIAIGLCIVMASLGASLPIWIPREVTPWDVIGQALFLDKDVNLLNRAFWTLTVEFRWYFIFPIALWLWTRSPRAFFVAMTALIVGAQATRLYTPDLEVLPAFMLGIVAASMHVSRNRLQNFALLAFPLLMAAAIMKTGYDHSPLLSFAMFAFVVAAGATPWMVRALSIKALTAIGLASYSIYLVHAPIMLLFGPHPGAVAEGVVAAAGVLGGFIFWFLAERPFVEMPIRARLVREFEQVFEKWFPRLGISPSMSLAPVQGFVAIRVAERVPALREPATVTKSSVPIAKAQ